MGDAGTIEAKYRVLAGRLDEATLRLWAAVEAHRSGTRQGGALRVLRCRCQSRLGERWDRSRHGRIRRRKHSALVAGNGPSSLSKRPPFVDYGRVRRQQRLPGSLVAPAIAEAGRRVAPGNPGLSCAAGNQQVEQDRTSDVLPYNQQLARASAGQPRGRGQSDWQHDHRSRAPHSFPAGRKCLPSGASRCPTKSLPNWPSSGTNSMANGTTACVPATRPPQHKVVFKLFLLETQDNPPL